MAGLNKFDIIGYLGRDPETRHTQNDKQVTSFSVAVDSGWGDKKETLWIDVSCFGRTGEIAAEYLHKGSQVYVTGPVTLNVFERKNGEPGASIRMTADRLVLLGSKNGDSGESTGKTESKYVEGAMPF